MYINKSKYYRIVNYIHETMKKFFSFILFLVLGFSTALSQALPAVSVLGDSYSTYEGFIPEGNAIWYHDGKHENTDVTSVHQTWWYQFIEKNHYKLSVNNSYSGATICNTGYGQADYSDRSFTTRMKSLGCPDIIFIFGGTNDSWAHSPIGEYKYENWTPEDLYNFRPAMACLLSGMMDYYPNVKIYFLLNDGLSKEVTESAKEICSHYGIGCIELSQLDKINGHPSIKGMNQIVQQIENFLGNNK